MLTFGEEVTTSAALWPWMSAGSHSCSKRNEAWVHCLVVPLVNQCSKSFIWNKSGPPFVSLKQHQRQHSHVDKNIRLRAYYFIACNFLTQNYHSYSSFAPNPADVLAAFQIKSITIIKHWIVNHSWSYRVIISWSPYIVQWCQYYGENLNNKMHSGRDCLFINMLLNLD